jgi:ketosteroid isomerase-like protein
MKKTMAFLLLSLILTYTSSVAQSTDEKAVADRVEMLRKAMVDSDTTALRQLAADDLSYGHSTGLVEDKAAFVDEFITGKSDFKSINLAAQTIKIVGNVAIVRHHLTGDTNNNNVPGTVDLIILLIWQKQKGQWKLLARQAAKTPAPVK